MNKSKEVWLMEYCLCFSSVQVLVDNSVSLSPRGPRDPGSPGSEIHRSVLLIPTQGRDLWKLLSGQRTWRGHQKLALAGTSESINVIRCPKLWCGFRVARTYIFSVCMCIFLWKSFPDSNFYQILKRSMSQKCQELLI